MNRKTIVKRHCPIVRSLDPLCPFTVGNGEFAFTADITGLQTFASAYEDGIPLHTQSQWGWHSFPNPHGYRIEDTLEFYEINGRRVGYAAAGTADHHYSPAAAWLRANPHRLDLGRFGLILRQENGEPATPELLSDVEQTLDLWAGRLESRFTFGGERVHVTTVCHPDLDMIGVRIESVLLAQKRAGVRLAFPYGREDYKRAADWERPDAHLTTLLLHHNWADFARALDADSYFVRLEWSGEATLEHRGPHEFELWSNTRDVLEFTVAFAPEDLPDKADDTPDFNAVRQVAEAYWGAFWQSGAAIDLSQSRDSRWRELERRVVLSQYLMAVNCAGSAPPQETGLTYNSWFGKMHLEMHWWHAMQFALWGRLPLLEKSLGWYQEILPLAQENARRQGYGGARWPKMVARDGHDSPSSLGVFLIWQQPHPLYYAELCYRENPTKQTLERYRDIVFETAEFMASYALWDEAEQRYVLGSVMIPAQESYGHTRTTNINPPYELAYWYWGLGVAQQWRERSGLERAAQWDHVRDHLAKPPMRDGVYSAIETPPYTIHSDHPSMLGAMGMLPPPPSVDTGIMERTLESVFELWDWASTWGWDYPTMAMTAARVGRPELAIEALLSDSPKNVYLPNGHNYQDRLLTIYLPGNGGLLAAIAMMAGGWDNAPAINAPGFPQDGSWKVQHEGFVPMP